MAQRLDHSFVYNYFKENNCELLEQEYINLTTYMKYRCHCGNIDYITFANFKVGRRCKQCKSENYSKARRFSYGYVYNYFKENECELLESTYINAQTKMQYKCSCGNLSYINFNNFKSGKRCWQCRSNKISDKNKLSYEYVFQYFKEHGCILLEDKYVESHIKMKYQCSCGEISHINFNNFREGKRCKVCGIEKESGSNNWHWNSDLTLEERLTKRNLCESGHWRDQIFKRDDYTCQICGKRGVQLNAHHLDAWHWCIEKRFDLDNGITLCKYNCHKEFHQIYGRKNNTKGQFEEFQFLKEKELGEAI